MDRSVRAVSKKHLDRALSHTMANVQKVAAMYWDPLFTCTNEDQKTSLADQLAGEPMIREEEDNTFG